MRIENFRKVMEDGIEKAVATVIFEDSERSPGDIYFHTSEEYNEYLRLSPDAFLLAGYLSAMYMGERRIYIQGMVDEDLKKGLIRNMKIFQKWYGRKYKIVSIESDNISSSSKNNIESNTGLFFSGGVDSIYSLQRNRLKYKIDHPLYVKYCFIINGFDMNRTDKSNEDQQIFKRAFLAAGKITDNADANLIPVYTNLRHHFFGDESFWPKWHHGAALAAVAYCFSSKINSIIIASSFSSQMLEPYGSHPQIDPNYSSNQIKVIHDELCSTILKLESISHWTVGFQNIRSCYKNDKNNLNCCKCEKCVRIMLTLMALGLLKNSLAFPVHDISLESLKNAIMEHKVERHFKGSYLELVPYLKNQGHQDLANIILSKNQFKSKLRRFDQAHLNGNIKRIMDSLIKTK